MSFKHFDGTRAFKFEIFKEFPLSQAIFTRHGGVSPEPWHSLNVGGMVGDDPARVAENRRKVFQACGRDLASAYDVWQVHSAEVVYAKNPRGSAAPQKADAIITADPETTLFMRFADCVPIFLLDPRTPAIGLVHAGWLGTVRRTVEAAVLAMIAQFGTSPEEILAGIGPSIGPDHYEVGQDVLDQFEESFGPTAQDYLVPYNQRWRLDLWTANQQMLQGLGVSAIEIAGICTVCDNEDWYSHRAEHGRTGRFAAILGLE